MMLPLKLCVVFLLQVPLSLQQQTFQSACSNSPYRTYDGSCNNLGTHFWGAANTPFVRIVNPKYADGKSAPPLATDGSELPNARLLSVEVFQEGVQNSPEFSLANMQFGQIVAHDMGFTRGVFDPITCCASGRLQLNRGQRCLAIPISPIDPIFSVRGIECLNMVRTLTTCDENPNGCKRAEQINSVTHFLDLSVVYGNSAQEVQTLRELNTGFLNASTFCTLKKPADACYHITFVREHNRIARQLKALNPTWNPDKLFEEARRINIAKYQHIVYTEWLPVFLGRNYMINRKLLYQAAGPTNDYSSTIDPSVINSFTTAAFRSFHSSDTSQPKGRKNMSLDPATKHFLFRFNNMFGTDLKSLDIQRGRVHGLGGPTNEYSRKIDLSVINARITDAFRFFHSSIQGILKLYEERGNSMSKIDFNDHTNNPSILEQAPDRYADLLRRETSLPRGQNDISFELATKHFLFRFNNMFGTDLKSLDIQRGRDHGLGGYNDFVFLCFNQRATNWEDYNQLLVPGAVDLLSIYYKSVDDLDLTVGLAFEKKVDGTESGKVTQCILAEQFRRTRKGDRFFYENGKHFNTRQLNEIRKANMARILCDTSNGDVSRIQPVAFVVPSSTNPLVSCNTLPTPNLGKFQ